MKRGIVLLWLAMPLAGCESNPAPEPTHQPAAVQSSVAPVSVAPQASAAPTEASIAELRDPIAQVSVRRARELIWNDAADLTPLSSHDAVKTGPSSSAVVKFNDQSQLKVGESSIVVVVDKRSSEKSDQSKVDLPQGKVHGHLKRQGDRDVEMEVRTSRGWIVASTRSQSGAAAEPAFKIEVSPKGRLEVTSETGTLTVKTRDHEQVLRPHEKLAVKEPPTPPSPDANLDQLPEVAETELKVALVRESKPIADVFKILKPASHAVIGSESVTIQGKLTGKLKAYVNGAEITPSSGGGFAVPVRLVPGANTVTFQIIGPGPDDVRYESLELVRGTAPGP